MGKKSIFLSLLLIVVLVGIGVGGYMLWPAINGAITKNKYYTSEQVQEAYDKGYDDGINNETELNAQIEYYKSLTDEYYSQIVGYQSQVENYKQNAVNLQNNIDSLTALKNEHEKTIETLESANAEQQETIKSLNSNIATLTEQVSSLEQQKTTNLQKIEQLNGQIRELSTQISNLEKSGENKDTQINLLKSQKTELEGQVANLNATVTNLNGQISSLNSQVSNLQSNVQQLESTNALNLQTINSLNAQILTLNTQISELTLQLQNNGSTVTGLNKKIEELEKSIQYYEEYVKTLQSGEKAIVTFGFDGSVINVQVVAKGSKVSIVDPESTDYVIFNYWTVGGEKITLNEYTVNDSVTIVANVTYKYDVKFMVDNGEHNKQIVEKDHFATVPSNPSKDGCEFDGWTVNGVDVVDVSSYKITGTTTFVAKFTKLHTVTFMFESETKSTQKVRNGEYASNVSVESTDYKVFNGWTVNGGKVDVSSYKITADTTFIADITYKFDVKFMVDDSQHDKQIIQKDHFATVPLNPAKDGFEFDGWTINGNDIIDVSKYKITAETTFVAKFTKLHAVTLFSNDSDYQVEYVRHGSDLSQFTLEPTELYTKFWGWSLDGANVLSSDYIVEDDITVYGMFCSVLTGCWTVTVNRTLSDSCVPLVINLTIFESGIVSVSRDDLGPLKSYIVLTYNEDYYSIIISDGVWFAEKIYIKFLSGEFYCSDVSNNFKSVDPLLNDSYIYKLNHVDSELPSHSYLAPFEHKVHYTVSDSYRVDYTFTCKNLRLKLSDPNGYAFDLNNVPYVIIGDKIIYSNWLYEGYANSYDFAISDTFVMIDNVYYYFDS